jgi:hypothetical protein
MFKAATFSLDTHCEPFSYIIMKIMYERNMDTRNKSLHQILDAEKHMTLQLLGRVHVEQENG